MTVVVDASVLVDSLVEGPLAGLVDQRLHDEDAFWAPHLIDAEVGHALRAGVRRGELSVSAASGALDAPLVTLDARLAAAPGLPAVVECLALTEG